MSYSVAACHAAAKLKSHLGYPSWLVSVGVGIIDDTEVIFVYTKGQAPALDNIWDGYQVVLQKTGKIMPAKQTSQKEHHFYRIVEHLDEISSLVWKDSLEPHELQSLVYEEIKTIKKLLGVNDD